MNKDARLLEEAYEQVQLNEALVLSPQGVKMFVDLAHGNHILAAVYYLLCYIVPIVGVVGAIKLPEWMHKLKNIWKGFNLDESELEQAAEKAKKLLSGNQKKTITTIATELKAAIERKDYEEAAIQADTLKAYINRTVPKSLSK
jgi:hypothetical protein